MTIQKLPGSAITPGTITVTQLESSVATTVQTGGGPKLTNIQVTDNAYTVLDDTAVDVTGGYIKITGTGFVTGCSVIVGQLPAASVTFISSTEVRAQLSAQSAGTYIVYLVNPDGGVGIRVNGVTHSASPAWQTASSLGEQYDGVAINLSLVATDATSYTITSGSLPPGLSLNGNTGVISGTVSGVANDTLYTFTVRATDAQLQDSPRTFTVTITVSDPYFKLTTLLLSGAAISGNTIIRDSSNNGSTLVVYGDARASNFTPYGTGWSAYFDGSGDYIQTPTDAAFQMGTGDYTLECWAYLTATPPNTFAPLVDLRRVSPNFVAPCLEVSSSLKLQLRDGSTGTNPLVGTTTLAINTWYHLAITRQSGTTRCFVNGFLDGSVTNTTNFNSTVGFTAGVPGDSVGGAHTFIGYLSNVRVIKGTALYTANFTPATTNLTSVVNTSLLTCHTNRFMDGSTNNFAITRNGDAAIRSFNPFNITNTGVTGSMYFDGTGDYLYAGSNIAFQMGTGDFTYECYVYHTNLSGQQTYFARTNGNNNGMYFYKDTSNYVGVYYTGQIATSNITITTNQWYHLVATRLSGILKIFMNGTEVASVANTTNLTEQVCYIGADSNGTSPFLGYISNVRILKGTGYSSISIPTQPLTAIANTQLLTLQYDQPHNNHTFLDSSSNQFLITRNGNASQGTFSPFSQSGWSVFFDGDGSGSSNTDSISVPDTANLELGSDNFTIECWVFQTAASSVATRILNKSGAILINSDSTGIAVDSLSNINTSPYTVTFNAWTHVAVTRSSNTLTIYINGIARGSGVFTGSITDNANAWYIGNDPTSVRAFPGYISNFRMVKGVVVYTTNFTPPTSMLTAITGTTLLVCQSNRLIDNSTNNLTVTRTGDTRVVAFSPFAPTAVYNPVSHGGSAYFDRTGDFLSLATNNSFDFGTGNFTVELFYYPLAYDDIQMFFSGTSNYQFGYSASDSRNLYYYGSSSNVISGTPASSMLLNQWNHIVLVRSGTSLAIMSNGVRQGTATHSSSVNFSGSPIVGGYADSTASYAIRGYMAGFRAVKGVAIYDPAQTTYTVPAAPVAATTNTSLLLNFTDSAILDSTGRNAIETVADSKSSSVITKFTGGSMYFDGTGDYLVVPSSVLHLFGTQAFTVEAWVYTTTTKQYQHIYGTHNGDTNWIVRLLDNKIMMYTGSADITGATVLAINTWYHVAAVREGTGTNQTKLYVNGTLDVTGTNATNYTTQSQAWIGAQINNPGATYFQGYIADLRVTRGYARYTANFTAPTAPARLK